MKAPIGSLPDRNILILTRQTISPYIHHTPVFTCQTINRIAGANIYFKCENFQKVGAFKFRGATNAVLSLTAQKLKFGVAAHSSGNHAQALSLAAKMHDTRAYIVMPTNSPKIKVNAVLSYGGTITFCEPTLIAREAALAEILDKTGALEIHPYNDFRIIAGQATAAAELIESCRHLDAIIAPVGGGGLLSGTILSVRYFSKTTKVFGAEPLMANDAWQSFQNKSFVPSENPATIADGLRTSLGSLTFPIIMNGAHDILTATEEGIVGAMKLIWERMKIIIEPSAAVPLAALIEHSGHFTGKNIGVILSGGNVDMQKLPW
jgi:threonine dehydratase